MVGLGNPGDKYASTRHNIGFAALDVIAGRHGVDVTRNRFQSLVGRGRIRGADVLLAKPQTYMNLSGRAVREIMGFFKLDCEDLLVLYDDMDIEVGRLKIAARGGPGGHKGVTSIIGDLGRNDFARIKIGVGRPGSDLNPIGHVLGGFSQDEQESMSLVLESVASAAEVFVSDGVAMAQTRFNRKYQSKI